MASKSPDTLEDRLQGVEDRIDAIVKCLQTLEDIVTLQKESIVEERKRRQARMERRAERQKSLQSNQIVLNIASNTLSAMNSGK